MKSSRRLPAGFASTHSPRATLVSVYAAHVAYPMTVLAILLGLFVPSPSGYVVVAVSVVTALSWIVFGVFFHRSQFQGASRVWRYGDVVNATVLGVSGTDQECEIRLRYEDDGLVRIGAVAVRTAPNFERGDIVRVAVLDGHQPVLVPAHREAQLMTA